MPDLTYRIVVWLCRALFRAFGLCIRVSGADRLPATGPVVVAATHSSFLDFMFVGLVGVQRGRLVRFMAEESVFRSRLSGPLMRGMSHIPVDRDHGELAARQALRALRAGEMVGVYPEATIGRAGVVKDREDFRRGAAYLALATGAPLVPVAHWGIHRIFTVDGRYSLRRGADRRRRPRSRRRSRPQGPHPPLTRVRRRVAAGGRGWGSARVRWLRARSAGRRHGA